MSPTASPYRKYSEPVFITKNGKGDLAVMSIEAYEELKGKLDLYAELAKGLDDVEAGRTRLFPKL